MFPLSANIDCDGKTQLTASVRLRDDPAVLSSTEREARVLSSLGSIEITVDPRLPSPQNTSISTPD